MARLDTRASDKAVILRAVRRSLLKVVIPGSELENKVKALRLEKLTESELWTMTVVLGKIRDKANS